jgi:hypothetical protein
MDFRHLFNKLLFKFGYIHEKELILRTLPKEKQTKVRSLLKKLNNFSSIANINACFDTSNEITKIIGEELQKKGFDAPKKKDAISLVSMSDIYGYKPGMSRIYSLFSQNAFGAYAFIARHHHAVRSCLSVITDEIANDGYVLLSEKGTTKRRLKEVHQLIKRIKLPEMRLDLCRMLKLYGNAWILPHSNILGGKTGDLQLLSPPRILPDIDPVTDKIRGWLYKPGPGLGQVHLPMDKVYHLRLFSVDNYRPIGDPPLSPVILDIEADLSATALNNEIFQKGGMMGIIMNVKLPESDNPFTEDANDVAEDLQDRIDSQFSGAKAGQSMFVSTAIDKVWNVNPIGKLDASFKESRNEAALSISVCMGVPPEKIARERSPGKQYIPSLVEDSVNSSFDKSVNTVTSYVDECLNDILKDVYKINDVRIQAGGRYGAMTLNAAKAIQTLANSGPIITVNDALDRILGWEPLPADNPRGNMILDNTINRDAEAIPMTEDPEKEDFNFGKTAKKFVSPKEFFNLCRQISSGTFERRDKTHMEDTERVTRLEVSPKKGEKFYEDLR